MILANEMAIPGRTEAEVYAFVDKIINAMNATVKSGLAAPEGVLPGPIKLTAKAATVYKRAMDDVSSRTAASAFCRHTRWRGRRKTGAATSSSPRRPADPPASCRPSSMPWAKAAASFPLEKIRNGMLAAAAIGYLCKHNATLSAAEGGCQAEIGVASAMAAALIATAHDASPRVVENAAESALEHHLGMTCDPVAGFVQVPCIERCAFGAVKAWTAYVIASNEIAVQASRRSGRNHHGDGADRQGHEQQVQGNQRGRTGPSVTLC